jgi:hypothetical protein
LRDDQTPFSSGWWGPELGRVRPRVGTYGCYPKSELPPLPFDLRGDFSWLKPQSLRKDHIARQKESANEAALFHLVRDVSRLGAPPPAESLPFAPPYDVEPRHRVEFPADFLLFFRSADLQRRIRSCTDCFLDLCPALVPSPVAEGYLVRFLADSQSCIFWYVYLNPANSGHCVVASPDFYGTAEEQWQETPPDPSLIVFSEESFEAFICRFWLENEIWYCDYENRPLFPEGRQYLERYGKTS